MKVAKIPTSLKDKVQVLLDTAGSEALLSFFLSETPEINSWSDETDVFVNKAKGLNIEYSHVDNHGEGEGEDYWSVYKFTHGTDIVYVKFSGSYHSYNGSDYDEWFFVVPKAVEVTQFFRV